jgi:hypothetical protein
MMMDSELSPLKGRHFTMEDLLLFEPYLASTIEDTTFVMGLLHEHFESDVAKNVVTGLRHYIFHHAVAEEKQSERPHSAESIERVIDGEKQAMREKTGSDAGYRESDRVKLMKDANEQYFKRMGNALYYECDIRTKDEYKVMHSVLSEEELKNRMIASFAVILSRHMRVKPQREDLIHALSELTTMQVKNDEGVVTGTDFALYFQPGKAFLSKQIVASFENVTLKSIIKDVLNTLTVAKRQYIYGVAMPGRPDVWETIITNPTEKREPIRVVDPNYIDSRVKMFEAAAAEEMHSERLDKKDEHDPEKRPSFFCHVNSDSPMIEIDGDLDRYAAVKRLTKLGLKAADFKDLPSPFPDIFNREILAHVYDQDERELPQYPKCLPISKNDLKHNSKRGHANISVNAKIARYAEESGFDLPPIRDSDVCEVSAVAKQRTHHSSSSSSSTSSTSSVDPNSEDDENDYTVVDVDPVFEGMNRESLSALLSQTSLDSRTQEQIQKDTAALLDEDF